MGQILGSTTNYLSEFFDTFLGVNFNLLTILDIFLTAWLIYWVYLFLKRTRAIRILYGFLVLAVIWAFGHFLKLSALNYLLNYFITLTAFAIPVVFQPELRSLLEKLGRSSIVNEFGFNRKKEQKEFFNMISNAVWKIKNNNVGALIVFQRNSGLRDLEDNGLPINGVLTPQILISIFTKGTPLHDGAVLIRGHRIIAAAIMIPVTDAPVNSSFGMRHRAALSITSETDAVCVVVSEERKYVSIAIDGKLSRNLTQDDFIKIMRKELTNYQS